MEKSFRGYVIEFWMSSSRSESWNGSFLVVAVVVVGALSPACENDGNRPFR